ncbi:hypothetical protein COLSTE_00684 [Collinsella stercoris DSM 13279]|uniref:Uncharacterized protein n=1 Tax=Collinsella stercoris DSM 13279 TaxID=445975 RepID=B6G9E3_9ACTN|nr:hypothetical protein COLSTE_00684 [Collinsella stercoris DSM 13279]
MGLPPIGEAPRGATLGGSPIAGAPRAFVGADRPWGARGAERYRR